MTKRFLKRPSHLPLRWRLTLWYLLTLAVILILFSAFLYWQLQHSLYAQVDSALQLAASQALINIDAEGNSIGFQNVENNGDSAQHRNEELTLYLLTRQGDLIDRLGQETAVSPQNPPQPGYITLTNGEDMWRIYTQAVTTDSATGWVQVIQNLDRINETLENLLAQMAVGVPLALALAGFGGYFLAFRALRPIVRITRTAQAINASDMDKRIDYAGPADEVGQLAATFDSMLDRLQAAFIRERQFTGDAAHELRTPLAALKGRLGVTLSQPRETATYKETLQDMEQQVDRLIRLSNDLLFMARLDQRRFNRQAELINMRDFLGAVIDQIRPLAANKAITLTEAVPENLVMQGDIDLLIRLFLNLLDNAVKYTPVNGRVSVAARQIDDQLSISISDTGPGIPPEHLPHLFERFYRVESDRARRGNNGDRGGAGLGLAIAYEIARAHGGRLEVSSQPGQGTTFTFSCPLTNLPTGTQ